MSSTRVCFVRLIQHTKALMSSEEKLCIKVLRTLQEMLIRTLDFDEKVRSRDACLAGWLAGWLASWLAGWLGGWLVC